MELFLSCRDNTPQHQRRVLGCAHGSPPGSHKEQVLAHRDRAQVHSRLTANAPANIGTNVMHCLLIDRRRGSRRRGAQHEASSRWPVRRSCSLFLFAFQVALFHSSGSYPKGGAATHGKGAPPQASWIHCQLPEVGCRWLPSHCV